MGHFSERSQMREPRHSSPPNLGNKCADAAAICSDIPEVRKLQLEIHELVIYRRHATAEPKGLLWLAGEV